MPSSPIITVPGGSYTYNGSGSSGAYGNGGGGGFQIERITVHQQSWLGKETTPGTLVATPNRLVSFGIEPMQEATVKHLSGPGSKIAYDHAIMNEWSKFSSKGYPTYNEMGWILSSFLSKPMSGAIGASVTAYRHIFYLNPFAQDAVNTFSATFGDSVRAHTTTFAQYVDWALNLTRQDGTLTANGVSQLITDAATIPTGINEVQTLALTGIPTGGTFQLGFRGQNTGNIAIAAITSSTIQTALNALPTIGASGVAVSGSGPYTVTFNGGLVVGVAVPNLFLAANAMTGGTTPSLTVTKTTAGGYVEMSPAPIEPGSYSVYLGATYSTIMSSKLTRVFLSDIKSTPKTKEFWTMNDQVSSFTGMAEDSTQIQITMTIEADANGMGLALPALRAGTPLFLRILATTATNPGTTIDGTYPFQFILDSPVKISAAMPFQDEEGVYAVKATLDCRFDPITGNVPYIQLDNDISGY